MIAKLLDERSNCGVQQEFLFQAEQRQFESVDVLNVAGRMVRLEFVRNSRAKRYILRLAGPTVARVTIPLGGSKSYAREVAYRNLPWLEKQLARRKPLPGEKNWHIGSSILFRGELEIIEQQGAHIRLGRDLIRVSNPHVNLRPAIETYFRHLAAMELPVRVVELAKQHGFAIGRVTVRNQKSRWGSCSQLGNISLNWRLVRMPTQVSDYIILHELAHLKVMSHSPRYWREVKRLCPEFASAEQWLKVHGRKLM